MSSQVVRERRRVSPTRAEAARVDGYRLVFDDGGVPLIEPAFASIREDAGASVWGVLYHLPRDQFASLDRFESPNYRLVEVAAAGVDTGLHTAVAYVTKRPTAGRRPSQRYIRLLCEGALEHNLPEDYLAELRAHPTAWAPPGTGRALNAVFHAAEWLMSHLPASAAARRRSRSGFPEGIEVTRRDE